MVRSFLQCALISGLIVVPSLLSAQPPGRGGQRGGQQGGMQGGPPPEMIIQLFTQADTNNDGSVTKAELTAVMQNQANGGRSQRGGPPQGNQQGNQFGEQRGPGGPPPREGGEGEQHGAPPQPGQVLPAPIAESLNLNERQTRMLAALQADVDQRLAAILTDEQKVQLQNARPAHGPGHGGGGQVERRAGRPE